MAQVLTVFRAGTEWRFRDVTGAEYGQSQDISFTIEAAERMAQRIGSKVVLEPEAEKHRHELAATKQSVDTKPVAGTQLTRTGQTLWARFASWWKRAK